MSVRIGAFLTRTTLAMAKRFSPPVANMLDPPRERVTHRNEDRRQLHTSSRNYDKDPFEKRHGNDRLDDKRNDERQTGRDLSSDRQRDRDNRFRSDRDEPRNYSSRDRNDSGRYNNDRYSSTSRNDTYANDRNYNDRPKSFGQSSSSASYPDRPQPQHNSYGAHRRATQATTTRKPLAKEMESMIQIEHHHIVHQSEPATKDGLPVVEWCPEYMSPDIRGHIRGGTALLHHKCRGCQRICLHLMGQPGQRRTCLVCGGYDKDTIPDWYYHSGKGCSHCKHGRR